MQLTDTTIQSLGNTNFQFSYTRPEALDSVEYTLGSLIMDFTGSLNGQEQNLLKIARTVLEACKMHPRRDFMMLRIVAFNNRIGVKELLGFTPVTQITDIDLNQCSATSSTNLYDAIVASLTATQQYAKTLQDQEIFVNGITFIGTDGEDCASSFTSQDAADAAKRLTTDESMESHRTILLGLRPESATAYRAQTELAALMDAQYEKVDDLSATSLAKMGDFISKSLSAQSVSLGSGSASKPIQF